LLEKAKETIVKNCKIFVTTCSFGVNKIIRENEIQRVIIDEATQATELLSFFALDHAKQLVLIGDDKQLGPVLDYQIIGPDSLFERLVKGGYPKHLLNVQYRMHPFIMKISNEMFY
jgi:superfamily I DNA and/or RNA helicase